MIFPIEIQGLSYRYPGQERDILEYINLKAKKGEILAIVGLSGSGKSTLCYCMCGIIPHIHGGHMKGRVLIDGVAAAEMRLPVIATKIGIVFQDPDTQIFSPTVEDEVAFGAENLCIDREEIGRRIDMSIKQVGMEKYRYSNPNELSGGQKQLVALASVLSLDPDILIFDEVMSQIDYEGKKSIKKMISNLKQAGKTIIYVEHDWSNLDIADRVVLLKKGRLQDFNGSLQ